MAEDVPKPTKKVAVFGTGTSGLAAIKQCLDEGIAVQAFEKSGRLGGQWAYEANPQPGEHSSMYDGCVLNSCRDTSSFSDFPLDPARYPDYFPHRLQLRYLREYADHFELEKHVRFRTAVLECKPRLAGDVDGHAEGQRSEADEPQQSGWTVRVREDGKDEVEELEFDAIFCCTGSLSTPAIPEFKDRDRFRGEFLHSHYYRTPGRFEGKRVAIIGAGSSAIDIACELGPHTAELHHVVRRGVWVLPRYLLGKPIEAWADRATETWLPFALSQWLQTKLLLTVCGKPPKELMPEHKILEQNPTLRSDFYEKVNTAVITPHKAAVDSFTETGLVLSDGTALDVDVVICATGYKPCHLPYLPADAVASRDAPAPRVDLYRFLVSPWYRDLYVLGQMELFGPFAPAVEAQARFATAVVSGRVARPSRDDMLREIRAVRAWQSRNLIGSDRHALSAHMAEYVDGLLAPLGANPTLGRVLRGRSPLRTLAGVYFGTPSSAQWRLFGYGKKEELARETVLRIAARKGELSKKEKMLLHGA